MEMKKSMHMVMKLAGLVVLLAVIFFFPWRMITWGRIVMEPERMITVVGTAESTEKNEIARFTAGVTASNDSRDIAVAEANNKINAITQAMKDFGIEDADIKTQSMSINQRQDWDQTTQKTKPGQWDVNNTIEVNLRDIKRANSLADILSKSGATNVWGPNFMMDNTKTAEDKLTDLAIKDALKKAESMATSLGVKLDKVISVNENSVSNGVYTTLAKSMDGMGGGGAALQPGSTSVSKSVTVVWGVK